MQVGKEKEEETGAGREGAWKDSSFGLVSAQDPLPPTHNRTHYPPALMMTSLGVWGERIPRRKSLPPMSRRVGPVVQVAGPPPSTQQRKLGHP